MTEFRTAYGYAPWSDKLPSEDLDVCEENMELFFKAMFERQEIWYKRFIKKLPAPWTNDPILRDSKFTNVYRELDRHSQWMIKNIHLVETNRKELIWKIMLFRIFNNPETFEWIKTQKRRFKGVLPSFEEYDKDEFRELIYAYRATGNNPYTNAYLINSQACPGCKRDDCYLNKVVPTIHSKIEELNRLMIKAKDPREIIKFLTTLPAVATFVSHEFYQDFTYAPRYAGIKLMKFDQNDFTNVGPGASIGIRLIFPSLKASKQIQGIYDLREIASEYLSKLGDFKYLNWSKEKGYYVTPGKGEITLHAVEMWLCEFQKYWKMMIGEGKQRSKFVAKSKTLL